MTEDQGLTPSEPSSIDVCECGHLRATHGYGPRCIGNRNLCGCMGFQARKKSECQHPDKQYVGGLYDGPGGRKSYVYYSCPDCKAHWKEEERKAEPEASTKGDFLRCQCTHFQMNHRPFTEGGCRNCACDCFKLPDEGHDFVTPEHCDECAKAWRVQLAGGPMVQRPVESEPPLTPEEEEEAPADDQCDHLCECEHEQGDHSSSGNCKQCDCESSTGHYVSDCEHGCRDAADALAEEAAETCCVCGEGPVVYHNYDDEPFCRNCADSPSPQPDRRPPYAVAYSVQGHLYEVALPGDATVKAVDGALVIQHALGPVAGIVQVLPVVSKESADV